MVVTGLAVDQTDKILVLRDPLELLLASVGASLPLWSKTGHAVLTKISDQTPLAPSRQLTLAMSLHNSDGEL
jgi:hypothetical protein